MRDVLRRKLPKTRGWYTGIILGILALIALIVWLIWRSMMAESPQRTVEAAIDASRTSDLVALRQCLSAESLAHPGTEGWLKQFAAALARQGVEITEVDILREAATVVVSVPHRGATGGQERTEVAVKLVRQRDIWLIDLEPTMASQNLQFWQAVALEQAQETGTR
ncbi:MAG: hypothetical protein FJX75_04765 [Armatimonadetes bacterium]|nr:hypothetical protein [Armatimonadota bacterium]